MEILELFLCWPKVARACKNSCTHAHSFFGVCLKVAWACMPQWDFIALFYVLLVSMPNHIWPIALNRNFLFRLALQILPFENLDSNMDFSSYSSSSLCLWLDVFLLLYFRFYIWLQVSSFPLFLIIEDWGTTMTIVSSFAWC